MKILSLNCQSWKTAKTSVDELVSNYCFDLMCLTETWESKTDPVFFQNWIVHSKPRTENCYGGVAVLIKPSNHYIIKRRTELESQDVESIVVSILFPNKNEILLIAAYIPPNETKKLETLIDTTGNLLKENKRIILTGDLNSRGQEWGDCTYNVSGRIVEKFLHNYSIICVNDGKPTRRNSDSVIDLTLISCDLIPMLSRCETLSYENIRSDHIPVLIDIENGDSTNVSPSLVEKMCLEGVDWEMWKALTNEKFLDWEDKNKHIDDIDLLCSSYMEKLNECCTECIRVKLMNTKKRRCKPPWWNSKVIEAKHQLNKAKKSYQRRSTPQNFEALLNCEKEFKNVADREKGSWADTLCEKINTTKSPKQLWSNFKKLTSYQEFVEGDVLPLMDANDNPAFEHSEKCDILKDTFFSGNHLSAENFNDQFKEEVLEKFNKIVKSSDESDVFETSTLNRDISIEEVKASFQKTQTGKAAGPDKVHNEMLIHAGESFQSSTQYLFNLSFKSGKVPKLWKTANVKFLRKSGKADYHKASAYRPISLTSSICKCLERIINGRLYGFVEYNQIIDKEQEGFRKNHSTTQAVLRLVQDIYDGLNKGSPTVAVFIDLEKAFDSVWREGLIVKLHELGIRGEVLMWVKDFLTGRYAHCVLDNHQSTEFKTDLGVPQGSVISPLLFSLFLTDMFQETSSMKVKFADDSTIWKTGGNVNDSVKLLEKDLESVRKWASCWRMKLNIEKTEMCIFRKNKSDIISNINIAGKALPYNEKPKLLGVRLDESLSFSRHISEIEARANKSVRLLDQLKKVEGLSTTNLLKVYKALVLPVLEYACPVWQGSGDCTKLEAIQRKGLAICLGVPLTSSREAMEVELSVKPLEIRRHELTTREAARILRKSNNEPIKASWLQWEDNQAHERLVSPFGKMQLEIGNMEEVTGLTLHNIEHEISYSEGLSLTRRPPEYWDRLGSSKTRSQVQKVESKRLVSQMMDECDIDTVLVFTDGSCQPNPGPCGAGACLYLPNQPEPVQLSRPVSNFGSILLGELVAIHMSLEYLKNDDNSLQRFSKCLLMSDSQTAVGILTLGWETSGYRQTVQDIQSLRQQLCKKGLIIDIKWTPGHADIQGNELADQLAKQASSLAKEMDTKTSVVTLDDVKKGAHKTGLDKWQRQWDATERGRQLYRLKSKVDSKVVLDYPDVKMARVIHQLRLGYNQLNDYQYKIGSVDKNECACGEVETVQHYLLQCDRYADVREQMRIGFWRCTGSPTFSIEDILCSDSRDEEDQQNCQSVEIKTFYDLLGCYIRESGRFSFLL